MKKTTIIFLVLAILFSFAGCNTTSMEEEMIIASPTESFRSELVSIFEKIDTAFEQKDSLQLSNISCSFFTLINEKLDVKITPLLSEDRPSFCSIEYLPASEELDSHVALTISFEDVNIEDAIASSINKNFYEAHYYVDDVSIDNLMEIANSKLDKAGKFEGYGLSDSHVSISPLIVGENACRLTIIC